MSDAIMTDKQTGYASIDKPWLKYYREEDLNLQVPQMSINDYMESQTQDYNDMIAFEYMGKKITYRQFKKNRDKVLSSLLALGVGEGDIVSVCLPNIPEVGYVFYAISKLGAVANMLDPRTNESTLISNVDDAGSKIIITLDSVIHKFIGTNAEHIIAVSALNSLPWILQKIAKAKNKSMDIKLPQDERVVEYRKFIANNAGTIEGYKAVYRPNSTAVIAYTGGTTGVPKGVIVTNETMNAMIVENSVMGYDVSEKDTCINIAPPWTYYGLSNCFNAYLCMGVKSILIPALGPDELGGLIGKYKPNHVITVPSALIAVIHDSKLLHMDLSFLKTVIVGADKLDPTFEKECNGFLERQNAKARVTKGYGMTEVCAAATYTKGETNTEGTVGIPFIFEVVAIFDPEDIDRELPIGEKGEIAITGPKNMLGYFGKNASETSQILKEHSDKTTWVHTGDIGHMDSDGKLYIDGRFKRMFVRNGYKIFPGEIESQIMKNSAVLQAAVVGVEDAVYGYRTMAYIVLNDQCEESKVIAATKKQLEDVLYDYEIPDEIKIIKKMPLTGMNKVDYRELEKQANKILQ